MEAGKKKLLAVTLVFIFLISSLAISEMEMPPTITPVNENAESSNNSSVLLAYVPSYLQQYVGNQLNDNKIPHVYYGNLLNVNYTQNRGLISYIFSMLNETYGVQYFIFNSSDDFIPYEQADTAYPAYPYTPSNIYDAYDMNYIHNQGYYGNNTTIVVVDAYGDPSINYDASVFDNLTGLSPINLTVYTPEGLITSTNSGWASETAIDVEWSHAMAPGAKIDLVLSPGDGSRLLDSVEWAISHHLGNIISLSWGQAESQMTLTEIAEMNNIYKQAAEENITVVAASGDNGANDGTSSKTVNFPAADPYVLGVGGTTLLETSSGIFSQTAWGDTLNGKEEASGGGFSSYFSTPYYQIAPNYTESQRGVPDVALDANPSTGVLTIVDGQKFELGGTSIATPMWAGIIATMDQYYNRSLGLVNPIFYKISETDYYSNAFTQITSGENFGYSAGPGWNPVTGLGTPLVSNLINDTGIILNGYGTVATFNNTTYATGISVKINVPGNSVEQYNGSTYYYAGFYSNPENYIKFGISANETGYYYKYSVYENGTRTSGTLPGSSSATIGVKISGSEIEFTVGSKVEKELSMPLVFAGEYRAAVGVQQDNSRINYVNIPAGTFSSIGIKNETGSIDYTGIYQHGYSMVGTSSYNNITFSYSSGTLTASKGVEVNKQIYGSSYPVHIDYSIAFGVKSKLTFSLSNASSATYYVNGTQITGNSDNLSSGYYDITANSSGKNISREIYVPDIKSESISVTSSPSYYTPDYTLVIDGFFKYTGKSRTLTVYELGDDNFANINASGYVPGSATGSPISSITLTPEKVLLNIFVSNGNVAVSVNGDSTENDGGSHYLMIEPASVDINVTKAGYSTYNKTTDLMPGENKYIYVLLTPDNTSLKKVTGNVENIQYKYNLSNVDITYNGTSLGYTNQSGQYVLFLNGSVDATFHEYLYNNNTTSLSPGSNPVVYMTPANVTVNIVNFKITYTFPLGFYYAFVSWDKYPLSNFGEYVLSYSNNSLMLNSHTDVITSSGTTFAFIPGLTPGKTYYVMVDAYSSNGSFISSNEVAVHYTLISYLVSILIYLGIIGYIVFITVFLIYRRKRKKEREYDEYEQEKYNEN